MPVITACDHCRKPSKVPEDSVGKKARCPFCREVFVVTAQPAPPRPTASPADPPRRAPELARPSRVERRLEVAPPPPPVTDQEEDEFEVRPPEPKRPRRGAAAPRRVEEEPEDLPLEEEGRESRRAVRPTGQSLLRLLVALCALAGAFGSGALGYLWYGDYEEYKGLVDQLRSLPAAATAVEAFDKTGSAYPLLFVAAGLGAAAAVLAIMRYGPLAAGLMIAAIIAPAVILPKTAIFTGIFGLGALAALFIKSPRRAQAVAEEAAESGERPRNSIIGTVLCIFGLLVVAAYVALLVVVMSDAQTKREQWDQFRGKRAQATPIVLVAPTRSAV